MEQEHTLNTQATAFAGQRLLAAGSLQHVALAVKAADTPDPIVVLDDRTGKVIDLDLRGSEQDILARLRLPGPDADPGLQSDQTGRPLQNDQVSAEAEASTEPRGRGRPRLGVVAREVTLLPRHWDWLSAQSGGASVVLRKLVEEARRAPSDKQRQCQSQETAYRAMSTLGGDLPGFEEASRALFAADAAAFAGRVAAWPDDIRTYVQRLAFA